MRATQSARVRLFKFLKALTLQKVKHFYLYLVEDEIDWASNIDIHKIDICLILKKFRTFRHCVWERATELQGKKTQNARNIIQRGPYEKRHSRPFVKTGTAVLAP